MKTIPCDSKALALLAADALPAADAERLRRHLASCPDCAAGYRQLAATCAVHQATARELPAAELPERVLRNVGAAVREGKTGSTRLWPFRGGWNRGWALAGVAAGVVVLLVLRSEWRSSEPTPRPAVATSRRPIDGPEDAGPVKAADTRLLSLRRALNQSDAAFDGLLTAQASVYRRESTPVYRAGQLTSESDL